MENMLFLQTYMGLLQKVKVCNRTEAVQLMTEGTEANVTRVSSIEIAISSDDFSAIFQEFLSPDSAAELNVPNTIVTELELVLSQRASTVPLQCLDALKKEVLTMVYTNTFKGWVAQRRSTLHNNSGSRTDMLASGKFSRSSRLDTAGISKTRSLHVVDQV